MRELREQSLRTLSSRNLMRPRREEPVGTVVPLSTEDRAFLETARTCSFPISYYRNTKRNGTDSRRRYDYYSHGRDINDALRIMCSSKSASKDIPFTRSERERKFMQDLHWDYERGYIRFPSREPLANHFIDARDLARQHGMPLIGALFEAGEGERGLDHRHRRLIQYEDEREALRLFTDLLGPIERDERQSVEHRASAVCPPEGNVEAGPGHLSPSEANADDQPVPAGVTENQGGSDKDVLNDPSFAQGPDPDGYKGIMKLENAEHREIWFKALVEEWESLLNFGAIEVVPISEARASGTQLFRC